MAKGQGIVGGLLRDRSSALQGLSHPVSVSFRGQKGLSLAACLLNEAAQLLQELQGHVSSEVLKYIGKNELGLLKAVKDVNICSSVACLGVRLPVSLSKRKDVSRSSGPLSVNEK